MLDEVPEVSAGALPTFETELTFEKAGETTADAENRDDLFASFFDSIVVVGVLVLVAGNALIGFPNIEILLVLVLSSTVVVFAPVFVDVNGVAVVAGVAENELPPKRLDDAGAVVVGLEDPPKENAGDDTPNDDD